MQAYSTPRNAGVEITSKRTDRQTRVSATDRAQDARMRCVVATSTQTSTILEWAVSIASVVQFLA